MKWFSPYQSMGHIIRYDDTWNGSRGYRCCPTNGEPTYGNGRFAGCNAIGEPFGEYKGRDPNTATSKEMLFLKNVGIICTNDASRNI